MRARPQFFAQSCQEWRPVFSSAAGARPFGFGDDPLHTSLATSVCLSYSCLSVSLNQFSRSFLTSGINKAFWPCELLLAGCFLYFSSL